MIYDTEAEKGYISDEGDEDFEEKEDDDEGKEKDELGKVKREEDEVYEEEELINSENLGNMEGSSKGITKNIYDEPYYWFEWFSLAIVVYIYIAS